MSLSQAGKVKTNFRQSHFIKVSAIIENSMRVNNPVVEAVPNCEGKGYFCGFKLFYNNYLSGLKWQNVCSST